MGWLNAFYSPIWWLMMMMQGVTNPWAKSRSAREGIFLSVAEPIVISGANVVQSFTELVFAGDEGLRKLSPGNGMPWLPSGVSWSGLFGV